MTGRPTPGAGPHPAEVLTPTALLVARTTRPGKPPKASVPKPRRAQHLDITTNRNGTCVEIRWTDARAVGGADWVDDTSIDLTGAPSITVGYVIAHTADTITVVSTVNTTHYAHGITIPWGCVTQITTLHPDTTP